LDAGPAKLFFWGTAVIEQPLGSCVVATQALRRAGVGFAVSIRGNQRELRVENV
jgi:hypothetical protein